MLVQLRAPPRPPRERWVNALHPRALKPFMARTQGGKAERRVPFPSGSPLASCFPREEPLLQVAVCFPAKAVTGLAGAWLSSGLPSTV